MILTSAILLPCSSAKVIFFSLFGLHIKGKEKMSKLIKGRVRTLNKIHPGQWRDDFTIMPSI